MDDEHVASEDLDAFEHNMGDPELVTEGPEHPQLTEEATATNAGLLVQLCSAAEQHYGLRVAECDAPGAPARWGPVHRVHATGSLHYAHRAADISGNETNMRRFGAWASDTYGPRLAELIHNPGSSVKNGRHVPSTFWGAATWNAHRNHVHLAI